MKKYIFLVLLGLIVVPQLVFASWWNPFTWFSTPIVPIVTAPVIVTPPVPLGTVVPPALPVSVKKVTTQASLSKQANITIVVDGLNSRIKKYKDIVDSLQTADTNNSNFIATFQNQSSSPQEQNMVFSLVVGSLAYRTVNQKIITDLGSYITEMQNEVTNAINTKIIDKTIWNEKKFNDIDSFLTTEINIALKAKDTLDSQIADASDYVHLLSEQQPSTPRYVPSYAPVTVNAACTTVDQDVRNEIGASGGMATETQIDALIAQREQQLGCNTSSSNQVPSAICSDGTTSYSQNRSGTCSDHGGVSTWL